MILPSRQISIQWQSHGPWTPRASFFRKSQTLRLGQTNWAESFWGIPIHQPVFLQKTKHLYPNPKIYLGLGFEFEFSHRVPIVRANLFVCLFGWLSIQIAILD